MNIAEFHKLISPLLDDVVKTLIKKGADYSTEKDTFENFHRHYDAMTTLGIITAEAPRVYALANVVEKVQRLINLGLRDPENESVRDTIIDGIAYLLLYYGMYVEDSKNKGSKI